MGLKKHEKMQRLLIPSVCYTAVVALVTVGCYGLERHHEELKDAHTNADSLVRDGDLIAVESEIDTTDASVPGVQRDSGAKVTVRTEVISDSGADSADRQNRSLFCSSDSECSDGLFCNGVERCLPASENANANRCVMSATVPCSRSERCDELRSMCVQCIDGDGDDHLSIVCGGDDCDDTNQNRHTGAVEICDGIDNDCDQQIDEDLLCDIDASKDDIDEASVGAAYIFFNDAPNFGTPADGFAIIVVAPELMIEPILGWWQYTLKSDATARDLFVGEDCGLCNREDEFAYGQKGLD